MSFQNHLLQEHWSWTWSWILRLKMLNSCPQFLMWYSLCKIRSRKETFTASDPSRMERRKPDAILHSTLWSFRIIYVLGVLLIQKFYTKCPWNGETLLGVRNSKHHSSTRTSNSTLILNLHLKFHFFCWKYVSWAFHIYFRNVQSHQGSENMSLRKLLPTTPFVI